LGATGAYLWIGKTQQDGLSSSLAGTCGQELSQDRRDIGIELLV
jgi:hypothetical protein